VLIEKAKTITLLSMSVQLFEIPYPPYSRSVGREPSVISSARQKTKKKTHIFDDGSFFFGIDKSTERKLFFFC